MRDPGPVALQYKLADIDSRPQRIQLLLQPPHTPLPLSSLGLPHRELLVHALEIEIPELPCLEILFTSPTPRRRLNKLYFPTRIAPRDETRWIVICLKFARATPIFLYLDLTNSAYGVIPWAEVIGAAPPLVRRRAVGARPTHKISHEQCGDLDFGSWISDYMRRRLSERQRSLTDRFLVEQPTADGELGAEYRLVLWEQVFLGRRFSTGRLQAWHLAK